MNYTPEVLVGNMPYIAVQTLKKTYITEYIVTISQTALKVQKENQQLLLG